jgi:hypothetical protein
MAAFRWTPQATEAAQLVADAELNYPQIAEKVGVTRQTLYNWRTHADFRARVEERIEEYREHVRRRGIAQLERRVDSLNDRWRRMLRVIEDRGQSPDMQEVAGGTTGLLVRTIKGVGSGDDFTLVNQYEVDTGLLRELREHEKQAAQELGQWTEKKELTGQNGGPIDFNLNMGNLTDDELRHLIALGGKLAVDAGIPG